MNTQIEGYTFGEIVVGQKTYSKDLIIFPEKIVPDWWRKQGHKLCPEDVKNIIAFKPDILVVGTGAQGYMEVLDSLKEVLAAEKIQLIVENTPKACEIFNNLLSQKKRVAAALHLTC